LEAKELVAALEALAARLGIPIRYETIGRVVARGRPGGGLCRLRGQSMILVDDTLAVRERIVVLAKALGTFDLDGIYLPPLVRATILANSDARVLAPRPLARGKPGRDTE